LSHGGPPEVHDGRQSVACDFIELSVFDSAMTVEELLRFQAEHYLLISKSLIDHVGQPIARSQNDR
jgi:hypothetical protein